jgi:hypothetical protein
MNQQQNNNEIRVIQLPQEQQQNQQQQQKQIKPITRLKRIITSSKEWVFTEEELSFENQFKKLVDDPFVFRLISQKIYSYKTQDMEKQIFDSTQFVDLEHVVNLLRQCNMDCFYCKEKVNVLYEIVREPKQWTLERINNKYGHNKNNCVISCLSCNLRRRTMYHERYVFTKQMRITKIE